MLQMKKYLIMQRSYFLICVAIADLLFLTVAQLWISLYYCSLIRIMSIIRFGNQFFAHTVALDERGFTYAYATPPDLLQGYRVRKLHLPNTQYR